VFKISLLYAIHKFLGKLIKGEKLMATQKIRIKLNAFDHNLIDVASKRIVDTALKFGAKISGPIPLPTTKEVVTIIRATHKYKDSREQFESRTHFRLIDVFAPNQKAVDAVLKMNVPAGVDIKVEF
jgi:small subunit ribosomal protein S10